MSFSLANGEELNASHPDTFWIPERTDRECVQEGTLVKCMFDFESNTSERMWVEIVDPMDDDGIIRGRLRNEPLSGLLEFGDPVDLFAENIIDITYETGGEG